MEVTGAAAQERTEEMGAAAACMAGAPVINGADSGCTPSSMSFLATFCDRLDFFRVLQQMKERTHKPMDATAKPIRTHPHQGKLAPVLLFNASTTFPTFPVFTPSTTESTVGTVASPGHLTGPLTTPVTLMFFNAVELCSQHPLVSGYHVKKAQMSVRLQFSWHFMASSVVVCWSPFTKSL